MECVLNVLAGPNQNDGRQVFQVYIRGHHQIIFSYINEIRNKGMIVRFLSRSPKKAIHENLGKGNHHILSFHPRVRGLITARCSIGLRCAQGSRLNSHSSSTYSKTSSSTDQTFLLPLKQNHQSQIPWLNNQFSQRLGDNVSSNIIPVHAILRPLSYPVYTLGSNILVPT